MAETEERSLQERFAPDSTCFGCGPGNSRGLRIRSFPRGDEVVGEWTPEPHHEAFPGVLNGGILGTLLDCHGNWTAAWHLMGRRGEDRPPVTVTAEYHVHLERPTPTDRPLLLRARVVDASDRRATVEVRIEVEGRVTARGRGTFIAVKEGHPAAGRW